MPRRKNGRTTKGADGKPAEADQGPGPQHNMDARKVIIQECASGMREINTERADLNERAGDIRTRLRDAGIDVKSFMVALKLEDMAKDDRETYLDNLREHMAALGIGEQGSLFPDPAKMAAKNADFGEAARA